MGCFVLAITVFVVILYLVYMLSLPKTMGEDLTSLFFFLAVFNWIIAAIVACCIFMYVKRLQQVNPTYGKVVMIEAMIFISAQTISGAFNFWLHNGGIKTLVVNDRDGGKNLIYGFVLLPEFFLTEFLPALAFAYTVMRWGKLRLDMDQERLMDHQREQDRVRNQHRLVEGDVEAPEDNDENRALAEEDRDGHGVL